MSLDMSVIKSIFPRGYVDFSELEKISADKILDPRGVIYNLIGTELMVIYLYEINYDEIKSFINKNPNWVVCHGGEGLYAYLFSDIPTREKPIHSDLLHRGSMTLTKTVLIANDLD